MDTFLQQLEHTLYQVVRPESSASVQTASETLKSQFYERPECLSALVELMQTHSDPQIRQVAGIEARKLVVKFWRNQDRPGLDDASMSHIQKSLLESTIKEQMDLVRHTSARVIAAIARVDIETDSWPDLLPSVLQLAQSQTAAHREVAVYIIYTLLENDLGDNLAPTHQTLFELLSYTLNDQESLQVRVSSVSALSCLADKLTPSVVREFHKLVPNIMEVLNTTITVNDEKNSNLVFEVLNDLVIGEPMLLNDVLVDLLQHMIQNYALKQDLDPETRLAALKFVYNVARYRLKKIQSLKLGPSITLSMIQIVSQPYEDDDDDDQDESDILPARLALRVIDLLATSLPPAQVVAPILSILPSLLEADPYSARAAFLSISVCVEGAPDYISHQLDPILDSVVHGLQSDNSAVKIAALQALSMLAIELPALVSARHETLLPLVFTIMEGATSLKIGRSACSTLDSILETLDRKTITERYLHIVIPSLLQLVDHIDDLTLKGSVVTAVGSAAYAAGRNFSPYFQQTVETIQKFIVVPKPGETPDQGLIKLCGMTLDSLSTLCCAVGKEAFHPCLPAAMDTVQQFLRSNVAEYKESAYIFTGVVAKVFGDELAPYLEVIMNGIFESYKLQEFDMGESDGDGAVGANDDEEDIMDNIKVNSAVAIEKEYACDCMTEILAAVSPDVYSPYLERTLESLKDLAEHFYEDIQRSAIIALWRLYATYYTLENGRKTWTPGFPYNGPLSDLNRNIGTVVRSVTFDTLKSEIDTQVVATVFDCIASSVRNCGPAALGTEEDLKTLLEEVFKVFNKEHSCQQDDYEEFEEGEEPESGDISETEEALIDCAIDVLVQVACALSQQFNPIFPRFVEPLNNLLSSKNASERASGIGAFAEIIEALKEGISAHKQWIPILLQMFVNGLDEKKLRVRSVAAYGAGLLAYYCPDSPEVKASYPTIFRKLQRLLKKIDRAEKRKLEAGNDEEDHHTDKESLANACGCVARMILKNTELVPLNEVIPVLLSLLPLAGGFEENIAIFELIAVLVEHQNPVLLEHLEALVNILEQTFQEQHDIQVRNSMKSNGEADEPSPLGDDQTREFALRTLQCLSQTHGSLISSRQVLVAALHK